MLTNIEISQTPDEEVEKCWCKFPVFRIFSPHHNSSTSFLSRYRFLSNNRCWYFYGCRIFGHIHNLVVSRFGNGGRERVLAAYHAKLEDVSFEYADHRLSNRIRKRFFFKHWWIYHLPWTLHGIFTVFFGNRVVASNRSCTFIFVYSYKIYPYSVH